MLIGVFWMVETYFSAVTMISARPPESVGAAEASVVASAAGANSAKLSDKRLANAIDFHRSVRRGWRAVRAATAREGARGVELSSTDCMKIASPFFVL